MLSITTDSRQGACFVVSLRGGMDGITAQEFREFSQDLLAQGHRFVLLDASHLQNLSSVGITALLRFARRIQDENGALAIYGLTHDLELLFRFFGFEKEIPVFSDSESAYRFVLSEMRKRPSDIESGYASFRRKAAKKPDSEGARATDVQKRDSIPEVRASVLDDAEVSALSFRERVRKSKHEVRKKRNAKRHSQDRLQKKHGSHPPHQGPEPETRTPEYSLGQDEDRIFVLGSFPSSPQVSEVPTKKYFRNPVVSECVSCGLGLRYYHSGPHLCPGCGEESLIAPDGQITNTEMSHR